MDALFHCRIRRIALQQADLHGLSFGDLADADFLAQRLGGANPSAHAAEDVLVENGLGGRRRMPCLDLPDEHRDIDRGRARLHAGRVVAEIAAVRLDQRLVIVERRMDVGEIRRIFRLRQTFARDIGPVMRHGAPSRSYVLFL